MQENWKKEKENSKIKIVEYLFLLPNKELNFSPKEKS